MADEAYRAVFLRVHPTGKMVLSLTIESDGKEAEYARLVADELGVPALDVKVVPADTNRFFFRSDHFHYAQNGIPIAFWFDGVHEDYHQPSDEIKTIDFPHMTDSIQSMLEPIRWLADSAFKPDWLPGKKP